MDSYGKILKELRKRQGMTQKMLCENICSQSVLSRIEGENEIPNVVVMQQLCQRLGISVDYLLHYEPEQINKLKNTFEKFKELYRQKKYQELEETLKSCGVLKRFSLEREIQMYYYYLANCGIYLRQDYQGALTLLEKGLAITKDGDHLFPTEEEVLLFSSLGYCYAALKQFDLGERYLVKSIFLFKRLCLNHVSNEFVKIFGNLAKFLKETERLEEALKYVDEGITFIRHHKSYYCLEELFLLKSEIYEQQSQLEQAQLYRRLAMSVCTIDEIK
ncbi:transcriptional regulator with XRE-family HTH domain [Enterococcus sp. PF1-24]|uniref:helix-turn-helix domain-containing protein n=1 Tax=unclassified Enterococcus TaxID=2608891 RepID=UPI0024752D29|nr:MULTISPECIES: helix-turn-helix transcriptional regulator [unclassified Enterococcus]MDH6365302.1 transcriptional regulator with XRE-family HTH domain [Enterococcus sp. PFB1-1]MDH6402368.1 transcriptional regulator with XRE-family HTH domain [Enterococcus sp. PF1-24]